MARTSTRDAGLISAIEAAGGIARLARRLGLSQPTVSVWKRIPPHRVIQVEALTGLSRRVLRPDLYDVPEPATVLAASRLSGSRPSVEPSRRISRAGVPARAR